MTEQQRKELEYLRHTVLNSIVVMRAHVKQIEAQCALISAALDDYQATWEVSENEQADHKDR